MRETGKGSVSPWRSGESVGDLGVAAVGEEQGGAVAGDGVEDRREQGLGELRRRAGRLQDGGDAEQGLQIAGDAAAGVGARAGREVVAGPGPEGVPRRQVDRRAGGEGAVLDESAGPGARSAVREELEEEEGVPHDDQVPALQAALVDRPAVDEGSLAALEVTEQEPAVRGFDRAVMPRDGGIADLEPVAGMPADGEPLRAQRQETAGQRAAQHGERRFHPGSFRRSALV